MLNTDLIKAFVKIIPQKNFEVKNTKLRYKADERCFIASNGFVVLKVEIPADIFIDAPIDTFALELGYLKAIKSFDKAQNFPNCLKVTNGGLDYIINKATDVYEAIMDKCHINVADLLEEKQKDLFGTVENTSYLYTFFEVTQILDLPKSKFIDGLRISEKEENNYKITLITKADKNEDMN